MPAEIKFNELTCGNCGAQIRFSPDLQVMVCNYCGSNFNLKQGKILTTGGEPVESIVPFTISKERYFWGLRKWMCKGFFTRDDLADSHSLTGIAGIYIPFYAYLVEYSAKWTARSGFYNATKRKWFNWRRLRSQSKILHKIQWKDTGGLVKGVLSHKKTLTLASIKIKEKYRSFCENSSLDKRRDFDAAYISGFACEPFAENPEEIFDSRVSPFVEKAIGDHVKKDIPGQIKKDIRWKSSVSHRVLPLYLPFWVAAYNYKKKLYEVIMNGESGLIIGSKPLDFARIVIITSMYLPLVLMFSIGMMFPYDARLFGFTFFGKQFSFWTLFVMALLLAIFLNVLYAGLRRGRISRILSGH